MPNQNISDRASLLLAILSLSGGEMPGITRMQKIALLVSKNLEKDHQRAVTVFDDWVPDDYGGRSIQVYRAKDELIRKGMMVEKEIALDEEMAMKFYTITELGTKMTEKLRPMFADVWTYMTEKARNYRKASTPELLALSYQLFPELAINSKIKPEINRKILTNLSPLSPMYEENVGPMPSTKASKRKESIKTEIEDERFFKRREYEMQSLPDIEARKKLAKLVGLTELPKLDPEAIYRLRGKIAKDIPDEQYDSVDLVRAVRGD